jgi:Wax ester synthase-like Acyl-CoA acyltransferase domain
MYVVEGLDHGAVAVVAKVHHALMDGVGGMQFMASMFSLTPTPEPVVLVGDDEQRTPPPWERVLGAVPEVVSAPVRVARALVTSARAALRVRGAFRADQSLACGCRKLVRIADLRLCPSGGHGVMDHRCCVIHPNRPVADALGTSRDRGGWTQGSNCSGYSPP